MVGKSRRGTNTNEFSSSVCSQVRNENENKKLSLEHVEELTSPLVAQVPSSSSTITRAYNLKELSQLSDTLSKRGLLPIQSELDKGRKTLVLDLDETLIHSVFQPVQSRDMVVPVLFAIKNRLMWTVGQSM